MPAPQPSSGSTGEKYRPAARRLRAEFAVAVVDAACLPFRLAASSCRACSESCPEASLDFANGRLHLTGNCTNCGRCRVACPSGAIRVGGFARDVSTPPGTRAIELHCWKSPARPIGDRDTIRVEVPCLFGLAPGELVALRSDSLPREIVWIDRGWCANCSSGRGRSGTDPLEPAATLMRKSGLPESLQPKRVVEALPLTQMPAAIPEASARREMGRRAFLRGLVRETMQIRAADAATMTDAGANALYAHRPCPPPARRALIAGLSRIIRLQGDTRGLPESVLPRVTVTDDCCGASVCASHCPTGALHRVTNDHGRQLRFDSTACIACGHCAAVCPKSALNMAADGGYPTVTVLREDPDRHCSQCNSPLIGHAEEIHSGLCGHCLKTHRLARSAYMQLFGARG